MLSTVAISCCFNAGPHLHITLGLQVSGHVSKDQKRHQLQEPLARALKHNSIRAKGHVPSSFQR